MNKSIVIGAIVTIVIISSIAVLRKSAQMKSDQVPQPTNSTILSTDSLTEINTEDVAYFQDVKGFFSYPKANGSHPGVIMIHEWWGLNDNIKDMARELAKEGYQVLAVDLFKGSVAKTAEEARTQTSSLNQEEALVNLKAAVLYLKGKNASKIASLGWCFGGGQSLQLSVSGDDLDATVIYYGNLVSDKAKLANIKWPVLGVFGDKDTSIPVEKVKEFAQTLNELDIENSINVYPGVGHAFANPSGQNYAPDETKDAWNKTLKFLEENLKES